MGYLIFISIFSSVYFILHFVVYKSLTTSFNTPKKVRLFLILLFLFSALSFFIGRFLDPGTIVGYLTKLWGSYWFGLIAISFSICSVSIIVRVFINKYKRLIAIVSLSLIVLAFTYSVWNGARYPEIVKHQIKTKKINPLLNGFKIVQLTDIHLGSFSSLNHIERIVKKVNDLKPDIIVLTGDLVNENYKLDLFSAIFKKLTSKHGTFAVLGNHEYYVGLDYVYQFLEDANITLLINSNTLIENTIFLAGLNDDTAKRYSLEKPDLMRALTDRSPENFTILLNHKPMGFKNAANAGVDLQLSGHTHAGQLPPMDLIVHFYFDYPHGLYKYNSSFIYTSCGLGTWGPRMRLFSKSEIVVIELIKI